MSFNTQPTRVHHLEVNSDQTYLSGNTLDATQAATLPQADGNEASLTSGQIADGEARVLFDASSATLQYRSGATSYFWSFDTQAVH